MRLVSAHAGQLITVEAPSTGDGPLHPGRPAGAALTGLADLDALLPPAGLARGAVHEVLYRPGETPPLFAAMAMALLPQFRITRSEVRVNPEPRNPKPEPRIIWLDPHHTLYPPAVFAAGVAPRDLWIVRPRDPDETMWALAECLRCRGASAVVAAPLPTASAGRPLDRRDVRRLQLAVERGGGVGWLLRPTDRDADVYAAATRWLVTPARGTRSVQRWSITLVHGHGGQVGKTIHLEHCRDPFDPDLPVRATAQLAHRPPAPAAATA